MTKRVAIVGGGITGLSAAYYLEKRLVAAGQAATIDLFEAADRLGGKIFTRHESGCTLELGAESFLVRKPWAIELCEELGIADRLQSTRPEHRKTFIWSGGQFHQLPEGLSGFVPARLDSLMTNSLLTFAGKLRVMADLVLPRRKNDSDESLASFISRRLGKQAYDRMIEPLLCGIYCGDGNQLSLNSTFPQLKKLEREHGSLIRGLKAQQKNKKRDSSWAESNASPFVTFDDGMSVLINELEASLQKTNVLCNHSGQRIEQRNGRWRFAFESGSHSQSREYDCIVLAIPSFRAAKLLGNDDSFAVLRKIPHASTALVNLWYSSNDIEHQLDGYGFVIPAKEQQSLTAVTWTSSKHFHRAPAGKKLLRAYLGKADNEIDRNLSDSDLLEIALRELNRTMGISARPEGVLIQRWAMGSPQYTMQHPEILNELQRLESMHPGLYFCGASYHGVGIPDCVRDAKRVAEEIEIE